MFKNLFKKDISQGLVLNEIESDVMDIVNKEYPKIIQEIHTEFLTAGDRLLKNAQDLLDVLSVPNKEKVEFLKNFGFHNVKQVTETNEVIAKIKTQELISQVVSDFKIKYPNYKFITTEIAEKICKKYNLVLGEVSRYKGFVPEKNLLEMGIFFEKYPEEKNVFCRRIFSIYSNSVEIISESIYKIMTDKKRPESVISPLSNYMKTSYSHEAVPLSICAPISDMDMTGHKLEGVKVVKEIPDPVVLLPKNHDNGIKGYLILTAWGDEASDELVINQAKN